MDTQFVKEATQHELFALYDAILCELRSRGVTRSSNNPVADYTEWLAARAFGLSLQAGSTAGFDGMCAEGLKYEVKGRRRTPHNSSVQLSALRGLDKKHFDWLIGVIYRPDFTVDYAAQIPYDVVVEKAAYRAHQNAWILHLRSDLLADPRVVDITDVIRAAANPDMPAGALVQNEGSM